MKTIHLVVFFFLATFSCFSNVSVVNGLTHMHSGSSGDVITGEVILVNYGTVPERVTFSIADAIYDCEKPRIFSEKVSHALSSASWVTNHVNERVLAPKEEYVLKYTIAVPKDAELSGSYWSVLMVSVERPIREESVHQNIGLDTKIQYAVGLITNVNSADSVQIDFADVLSPGKEDKSLEVKIKNNGQFAEATTLTLEVYNQEGEKVKEYATKRLLVFPSVCRAYKLNISDLPNGEYECVLVAEARESFIGANLKLQID